MKKLLFLILAICHGYLVKAQTKETIRVKSEVGAVTTITGMEKYLFPQFNLGTVSYWNGQTPSARLNYNLLLNEMQFLSPSGDTLTLDQEHTIQKVVLNGEVFMYDVKNGFLRIIEEYGSVKLALSQSIQIGGLDKQGGYGQSSGVSSIKTYSSFSNGNGSIAPLSIKGDVVYSHRKSYLLVDQNNLVYPASRKNVLRIYPKQKTAIEEYFQKQSVRFNEPEDLQRLLEFCKSLSI